MSEYTPGLPSDFPDDNLADILPATPFERIEEFAEEILRAIGYDHSFGANRRFDATWYDEANRRHELSGSSSEKGSWYYLNVFNLTDREPIACYSYNLARKRATQYTDREYRQPLAGVAPDQVERDMIASLRTSGIVSTAKHEPTIGDAIFWDMVCHYVAEEPEIQAVIERDAERASSSVPLHVRYGIAAVAIRRKEPALTIPLIERAIRYAEDTAE